MLTDVAAFRNGSVDTKKRAWGPQVLQGLGQGGGREACGDFYRAPELLCVGRGEPSRKTTCVVKGPDEG